VDTKVSSDKFQTSKTKRTKMPSSLGQSHVSIHSYSLHSLVDINLVWEDFSNFWDLISKNDKLTSYVIESRPNLTIFLWSWVDYRKDKNIPLLGKEHIGLTCYRLGPRGSSGTWKHATPKYLSLIGDNQQCWTRRMCP
jgi:hypothetical protein